MRAADLLSERRHRNEPGECKEEQARGLENPGKAPLIARAPRIGVPCLARRADDDHHAQCQERGSEQHPRDQRRSVDAPQVGPRQGDNGSGGEETVSPRRGFGQGVGGECHSHRRTRGGLPDHDGVTGTELSREV